MCNSVGYDGPKAEFATLTGSPLWGMSIEDVARAYVDLGWAHLGNVRPPTPYGLGPVVQSFCTPSGREVIRIPSYGGTLGRDWRLDRSAERVFWILWQAGVKVLIVGGTSGTADLREGEEAVRPGDFVLPWSFRTMSHHRGLPGTPHETAWPRYDLLLDQPFCSGLSALVAAKVRAEYSPHPFRRVHTPQDTRVALVNFDGITFETNYDILMWAAINQQISALQPDLPPVVTLHGDCVNPVLARLLGIHLLYYHLPSNWAQGLHPEDGIVETLYPLYMDVFPQAALRLEAWMMDSLPLPTGDRCSCVGSKHAAPEVFSEAMTGPESAAE